MNQIKRLCYRQQYLRRRLWPRLCVCGSSPPMGRRIGSYSTSRQPLRIIAMAMTGDWRRCKLHGTEAEIRFFRARMRLIPTKLFLPVTPATSSRRQLSLPGLQAASLSMPLDLEMQSGRITGPPDLAHGVGGIRLDRCRRTELRLDRRLYRAFPTISICLCLQTANSIRKPGMAALGAQAGAIWAAPHQPLARKRTRMADAVLRT